MSLTKYSISWEIKPYSINSFAPFTEVQPQGSLCFISDEKFFSGLLTVDNTLPRIYHQTFPTHQEVEKIILQPGGGVGSPSGPRIGQGVPPAAPGFAVSRGSSSTTGC